jgi:general stress protein 26
MFMNAYSVESLLEVTRTIMEKALFCFLMTASESGAISARLMQPFGPEEGLVLWFGASATSRKVRELRADARATVAFEAPAEGAYASLQGTATVEMDPALRQRYWRESFAAFWPAGPAHEQYVVLRFEPTRIELMHIDQGVAPEPFGLQPAVLVREAGPWRLSDVYPGDR